MYKLDPHTRSLKYKIPCFGFLSRVVSHSTVIELIRGALSWTKERETERPHIRPQLPKVPAPLCIWGTKPQRALPILNWQLQVPALHSKNSSFFCAKSLAPFHSPQDAATLALHYARESPHGAAEQISSYFQSNFSGYTYNM